MAPKLRPRTADGRVRKPRSTGMSHAKYVERNKGRITAEESVARKMQWDEDWATYIASSKERKGEMGIDERKFTRGSEAMAYYELTREEIESLPCRKGDLYGYRAVKELAYRKNAMGSGWHTKGWDEHKVLKKGKWWLNDRIKHTRPRLVKPRVIVRLSRGDDSGIAGQESQGHGGCCKVKEDV